MRVVVDLLEFGAVCCLVVAKVEQVVCCATFILFTCVEVIFFGLEHGIHVLVDALHLLKALDFAMESFFSQVSVLILHTVELLLTDFLISHCEVLVKPLLFCSI